MKTSEVIHLLTVGEIGRKCGATSGPSTFLVAGVTCKECLAETEESNETEHR